MIVTSHELSASILELYQNLFHAIESGAGFFIIQRRRAPADDKRLTIGNLSAS